MKIIKCDQPGCDFVARHDTSYVKCIIARHRSIKHGIRGKLFKYSKAGKAEAARNSEASTPQRSVAESVKTPNFCPNCGCNLRAVTAALNLRRAL